MAEVLFFLAGIGAIAGAIGVVAVRNPFYSVLALVSHLLSLAALFLLLRAEFVAAAQVVVYAGAVMVLYVFVVAYVGGQDEPLGARPGSGLRVVAALFGAALFVELCVATLGSGLKAIGTDGPALPSHCGDAPLPSCYGSPKEIGELLLTRFLLPFEVASFLLLIAAVGAVVLARRRGGISAAEDQARYSAMDMLRPAYTGTMAEAVGGPRPGSGRPALPVSAGPPDADAASGTEDEDEDEDA
jgi:NADH-quinone oxidoreductase subunit J